MKLLHCLRLAWRMYRTDSNLAAYAQHEFTAVWPGQDNMQDLVKENLIELLTVFSSQGHSGFSAGYILGAFEKLARFKPLGPLTGAECEWAEPFDNDGTQQNRRCGAVFRLADGTAYYLNGKVFIDTNGGAYTNFNSRVYITEWPYTPVTEYVNVEASE